MRKIIATLSSLLMVLAWSGSASAAWSNSTLIDEISWSSAGNLVVRMADSLNNLPTCHTYSFDDKPVMVPAGPSNFDKFYSQILLAMGSGQGIQVDFAATCVNDGFWFGQVDSIKTCVGTCN